MSLEQALNAFFGINELEGAENRAIAHKHEVAEGGAHSVEEQPHVKDYFSESPSLFSLLWFYAYYNGRSTDAAPRHY